MNKKIILFAIGLVFLASGCKSKKEKTTATIYTVTTAQIVNTSITKDYVASIMSEQHIDIRAQKAGILQDIYVDEGQSVRAGQVLFRIITVGTQQEIEKSKSEVEQSRIDLENTSTLAKNNIVSNNAQKMANAKLNASLSNYKLACLNQKLSVVRAPFSGIIGRIPNKKGSLVQEGDLLSSLSNNNNVYAYFNVSEPEYLDYQQHSSQRNKLPLTLILSNGTTFDYQGHLQNILGDFDNSTGNIPFRAKFPNKNNILRNGQTATLRMDIPVSNAMVIPQQATYELQDQKYVFVVDAKGYIHARQIKVAFEKQDIYIISSGLTPNDKIMIDGIDKVNDADHISYRYKNPADVMQSIKLKAN